MLLYITDIGLLESSTDKLFRAIGIKGGQIVLTRKAVCALKHASETQSSEAKVLLKLFSIIYSCVKPHEYHFCCLSF